MNVPCVPFRFSFIMLSLFVDITIACLSACMHDPFFYLVFLLSS